MAPAVAAAVVPVSAWLQLPQAKSKPLKRRIQLLPALQWQYIAPTIPAATDRPKINVIRFDRKIKLPPPQALYPPATGPPSSDRALDVPFQTRTIASRRQIKVAPVYAPAATPAVVPQLPTAKVIDRRETHRALQKAPPQPVFPLAASEAPVAALVGTPQKRRKARQGLFLTSGGDALSIASTATTPAVYPSFVPGGFLRRKETERTLRLPALAPVFPATQITISSDRSLVEPFQTTRIRSRKRLALPDVVGVGPAAPETTPAVYASLVRPKTNRRKARSGLFLGGTTAVDGYVVPQPEAAWRLPKKHFTKQDRKLKREPVQPDFPATPPTPPQPEASFRLKKAYFVSQRRRLLPQDVLLEHPETPFAPPVDSGGGGWEPFHFYAIRRREMLREANQRKQEAIEEAKDDAVQKEIARRLHAELASQDERAQLARLRALVEAHENLTNASNKLETAFLKAKSERTFSRLQALQRELIKAQEEEEMAVLMILLADD